MKYPKRRFTRRIPVQRIQGIGMEVPDEIPIPTAEEQPDSVAMLFCPRCGARRYASQAFLDFMEEAKAVHPAIEASLARHVPCNMIMQMKMLAGQPEGA